MTATERKQRERDRKKAGLVRIEAWIPAHAKPAVMAAIDKAVKDAAEGKEDGQE